MPIIVRLPVYLHVRDISERTLMKFFTNHAAIICKIKKNENKTPNIVKTRGSIFFLY